LQAWQVPHDAVEQQTLSTQLPRPHSWALEQVAPSPFLGAQVPLAQKSPETQSVSALHPLLQAVAPQTKGAQGVWLGVGQVPVPVQNVVAVATPAVQDGATHITFAGAWVHAPAPLQVPVFPQVPLAAQRACGSASPLPTLAQVPRPFRLQAWQVPHDPVEQQTPSTQLLLPHSWAAVQAAPFPFRVTQLPPAPVQ
jgi:hypothetical protein